MAAQKVVSKTGEVFLPYSCKPRAAHETFTKCGDRFKINAKLSVDPVSGKKKAEPGEKIDLDAYIQASKASCDITTIIAKLKAGDESVINVREGFYGDTTILPKDINDINSIEKLNAQARESFDKLPDEIRSLFDNDPSKFFSAVLDRSAENVISSYISEKSKISESVEKVEE